MDLGEYESGFDRYVHSSCDFSMLLTGLGGAMLMASLAQLASAGIIASTGPGGECAVVVADLCAREAPGCTVSIRQQDGDPPLEVVWVAQAYLLRCPLMSTDLLI